MLKERVSVRRIVFNALAILLVNNCVLLGIGQAVPLSTKAEAVKRKADTLRPHDHISVIPLRSREEYGEFMSDDANGFTFFDIDLKQDVVLRYEDVKKIKNGYGGYNTVTGRHTDHTRGVFFVVLFAVLIGSIAGAAAAAK